MVVNKRGENSPKTLDAIGDGRKQTAWQWPRTAVSELFFTGLNSLFTACFRYQCGIFWRNSLIFFSKDLTKKIHNEDSIKSISKPPSKPIWRGGADHGGSKNIPFSPWKIQIFYNQENGRFEKGSLKSL